MAKRNKNKAQKPIKKEPIKTTPTPDLTKLEGQLRSRGIAKNGPDAQGMVYYYQVYVNRTLAYSPWMSVSKGDVIEVYLSRKHLGDIKEEWRVAEEEPLTTYFNHSKPCVDSLFGRGGISHLEFVERD